ncbi:MAG: FAD-dependent oxidoreductase [Acidimicrobiales bacterium]|nr:FAD-dependent oxidoreductase [Acidimicrobiales bacterium]MXY02636.1 FAD-dependent oxidoreductase [Acidimicrobiales bacterium]MYA24884.1 FAD-dependent oxidoreductase [Acidimicrobiales bacterium]MYA81757.1 FAD-dependent oxidoreductase [Acidimicrobiales bacterium]MYD83565.1 FAD-dependent oxidoreductase [Acidimicrobiales bacterium]
MTERVQAVVIGGGVVGASVLYHLTRAGWTDLVLLERADLTAGSTWHAAGGIHPINADPTVAKLQKYTIELYREIEAESGQDCGIHMTGAIFLADTPERLDWLQMTDARGKYLGIDSEMIPVGEAARLLPIIDPGQFVGAMLDAEHGHVDPSGVTYAYAKAATAAGAVIRRHTWARRIERTPDGAAWRIGLYDTSRGDLAGASEAAGDDGCDDWIEATHVVNAGGLWAREVGRMAGVELPVLAMEHTYVITEPLDAVIAHNERSGSELMGSIDFGGEIYTRQEGQGLLVGTYDQAAVAWQRRQTPWDFERRLLTPDLERIAPSLETAFRHFPVLGDVGIARVVNGPFTFSPDGNPLVGPIRGLPNFWSACGVLAGLCQGGGVGLALSKWMTTGDPGFDVWAMDLARFGDWATRPYTAAKVRENYRRRFSIAFPNEFLPEGRPLATTPIYEPQRDAGAVFGDVYGLEVPLWFAPEPGTVEDVTFGRSNAWPHVRAEVHAVRHDVGLMETSGFAKFLVEGSGARAWLTHLLAGRLPPPGRISLSPMCNERGNLTGDLTVACLPAATGTPDGPVHTATGGATGNAATAERFIIFGSGIAERHYERWFDADLARWRASAATPQGTAWYRTLGAELCGVAIAGPKSRDLLSEVTDADVSDEAMRFGSFTAVDVGWARAWCGRLSYTGDLGYELWTDARYLRHVFDLLMTHGRPYGLRLFGLAALNSLRLDKSFGSWAREYRPTYDPFEAGLGRFVRFTRAGDDGVDFVGRAALVDKYGLGGTATGDRSASAGAMALCAWTVDSPLDESGFDAVGDEPIYCSGEPVGWVTSGGFAHHSNVSVAMGYVPVEFAHDGADFGIEIVGERRAAHLIADCLWDPTGRAMRR